MSTLKLAKIIEKLLERTQAGSVTWEETAKRGVFQAAFPGYTVQLLARESDPTEPPDYVLRIMNTEGKVLEEVADPDLKEVMEGAFLKMQELYALSRRSALGVDEALDRILSSLEQKDVPF